ncbi:hypothetical protein AKJ41_02140 [candidate division MSBL1 archaeon SCGC-AAA259O05]|uniref:Uncharacterized protein n=1 Tax=candidate division MSBL1 archaeon SCGC-AAA259O05 TaxID=1698271 RepID=A0A133V4A3_9EURY|nr:hypothetical protein AKJ41_02140 [candidate division MSBL1 archaeon SCGC-AAA259O05]
MRKEPLEMEDLNDKHWAVSVFSFPYILYVSHSRFARSRTVRGSSVIGEADEGREKGDDTTAETFSLEKKSPPLGGRAPGAGLEWRRRGSGVLFPLLALDREDGGCVFFSPGRVFQTCVKLLEH